MSYPVTDETRAYMTLAYLIRSVDKNSARHWESMARHYGATEQQVTDAWKTRAALNAPTTIRGAA